MDLLFNNIEQKHRRRKDAILARFKKKTKNKRTRNVAKPRNSRDGVRQRSNALPGVCNRNI